MSINYDTLIDYDTGMEPDKALLRTTFTYRGVQYTVLYRALAELQDAIADTVQDNHPDFDAGDPDIYDWAYEYAERVAAKADARAEQEPELPDGCWVILP